MKLVMRVDLNYCKQGQAISRVPARGTPIAGATPLLTVGTSRYRLAWPQLPQRQSGRRSSMTSRRGVPWAARALHNVLPVACEHDAVHESIHESRIVTARAARHVDFGL